MGVCLRGEYHNLFLAGVLLPVLCLATQAVGADSDQSDRLKPFGDFRVRLEQDWDSLQGDGTKRDDRLRLRVRVRAGFESLRARQLFALPSKTAARVIVFDRLLMTQSGHRVADG